MAYKMVHGNRKSINYELNTKYWRLRRGISLAEYLVAFSIISIISVMVAAVYFAHFRLFSNQNTAIDVSTQARIGVDEITNQLRQAEAIISTCASCGGDTTGQNILIMQLWPIDASGEPIDPQGTNYDYIEFKKDEDGKLLKITYPNASSTRPSGTHTVANFVTTVEFTYDDPTPANSSVVTAVLTTSAVAGNKTHTATETGKATLRNK